MTRKDYELIALALRSIMNSPRENRTNGLILNAFVSRLSREANFNDSKFTKAVYQTGVCND